MNEFKIFFSLILIAFAFTIVPAFAETQTMSTNKGTLDVKLTYDKIEPNVQTKINIDFINPQTQKIQEHIDYTVAIAKDGETVFGPIPLTHTSLGSVKIPIEFNLGDGIYSMDFEVEGILFQPIPTETVSFDIAVGEVYAEPIQATEEQGNNESGGGGCLIATATFGSELDPQVQQLRELRDNTIQQTKSGTAFMTTFNQVYYSFSPAIADIERENPIFRETVKVFLTPLLSSLSLLNHVEINSEGAMIGYGISVILLNIAMYVGIPVFGMLKLYQSKQK